MKKFFLPARLVKASHCWYITYTQYNPLTHERIRFRKTFGINYIRNKKERVKEARIYIRKINKLLPTGWPFIQEQKTEDFTTLQDAVNLVLKMKLQSGSRNTRKSYSTPTKIFLEWCKKKKILDLSIQQFNSKQSQSFMDFVMVDREIGPRTFNNYITSFRAMWNVMVDREMIEVNPWSKVKKVKEQQKLRRVFTKEERNVIANYIKENDEFMFYAIILQYYCFIRPAELRMTRFKFFDVIKGLVHLPGSITKNSKNRVVTIPDVCIHYFRNPNFTKYPANYLIFGAGMEPHPNKPLGYNTFNNRHKKYLNILKKRGLLGDITGLSFYSWKDSGVTDLSNNVSLLSLQRQAGHSNPETTLIYYQPDIINHEVKKVDNDIFS